MRTWRSRLWLRTVQSLSLSGPVQGAQEDARYCCALPGSIMQQATALPTAPRSCEPNHGVRPAYPSHETILDQLHLHVTHTPDALALVVPEGDADDSDRIELSYVHLWSLVGQVASALVAARPRGDGVPWVILVLPQGLQQVVAVWGTLRSGCAYVPIDADTQAARLRMLFEETSPCLAIGEADSAKPVHEVAAAFGTRVGTFPGGARDGLVVGGTPGAADGATALHGAAADLPWPAPSDLALLLFSSGSTGTPKGIMYDHKWLMGGSYFVARDLELTRRSRCLLRCSCAALGRSEPGSARCDPPARGRSGRSSCASAGRRYVWSVSLYDLFPVTMCGGTLCIPPRGGHLNVQVLRHADGVPRGMLMASLVACSWPPRRAGVTSPDDL